MIIFSILTALYICKMNGVTAYLQWRMKQMLNVKRIKPFDCVGCMSFWIGTILLYLYGSTWDVWILTLIPCYVGGSLVESIWKKV